MRKLIGSYGILESAVAFLFLVLLICFDFIFIKDVFDGKSINEKAKFMVVFINLIMIVIISWPLIHKLLGRIPDNNFKTFIELPEKDEKFTFSSISSFLSDQALASFLVTILMSTGKDALATYGGFIASGYVFILFVVASVLGSISLVRFIWHFTQLHWFFYALASTLSFFVMFAFFNVGLKFGS